MIKHADRAPIRIHSEFEGLKTKVTLTLPMAGEDGPERVMAVGEAVCHPKDSYDKQTGETIAAARAMLQLSVQLFDDAGVVLDGRTECAKTGVGCCG